MNSFARISAPLRVLVVDDHRDTADALAWVLQKTGHQVRAAYDGASAIRAFEELSPHVVFQDLLLPGMSGLEIASEIRKRSPLRRTLLVAITGAANAAALCAAEREPFDDLIVKPVALKALDKILAKVSGTPDSANGGTVRGRTDGESQHELP
jgi:two-component system, OmpR family, response regulator